MRNYILVRTYLGEVRKLCVNCVQFVCYSKFIKRVKISSRRHIDTATSRRQYHREALPSIKSIDGLGFFSGGVKLDP